MDDPFPAWFAALEARYLSELTFAEVRRSLQALSSLYVERRGRISSGAALDGAGKRAAFGLFYGPLHFLAVRGIVRALGAASPAPSSLHDLGCGTGAAGAAWAREAAGEGSSASPVRVEGLDRSAWAVQEARWTYRALGIRGSAARGDLQKARLPGRGGAVLAAFLLNELEDDLRAELLARMTGAAGRGCRVLIVEPLARRGLPWWDRAAALVAAAGGRADEWRFPAVLPDRLRLLDRAAGLDHRELTARSLYLPGTGREPEPPDSVRMTRGRGGPGETGHG